MSTPASSNHCDSKQASTYDERWVRLAPFHASLHLQMRLILQELPSDARVLCVGVGTGAELLALARYFPGWRFVAVDPSVPMLEQCRRRAAEEGIIERCEFHATYLHDLPAGEPFHAATAILVSHFLTQRTHRIAFFREIADRLYPKGILVTADLCRLDPTPQEKLWETWSRMMRFTGSTEEQISALFAAYEKDVSILSLPEMEALLSEAGFPSAVHFSQTLMIHGWYGRCLS
ncbi:MAG TPA: methyltransferase domain-containing protein [Opitutaceae bacterium]|nr:methyltransferase domain-containing protein [Opitutaceae bacterium]